MVNDAFGVAHRSHASTVGVCTVLPAYAGLLLEKDARSAIAITAYLPFVVSFINYRCITTILVKFLLI